MLNPGTSYLSFQNSPFWTDYNSGNFDGTGGYFYLENFEDAGQPMWGTLTAGSPGLTLNPFGSTTFEVRRNEFNVDSVDADRVGFADSWDTPDIGAIDGNGADGTSIRVSGGSSRQGIEMLFNTVGGELSSLPTHVGVVWTDYLALSRNPPPVIFEAFDISGNSLGTTILDSTTAADNSYRGTTAEDRFLGIIDETNVGIARVIVYTNTSIGGVELDHIQYGVLAQSDPPPPDPVPEPSTLLLLSFSLLALLYYHRSRQV